jgi:FkbM family methyltransferase
MVLSWLYRTLREPGFYVDVGAHHPIFLSNTYGLYCKGWRGVCVEPRAGVADEFRVFRPRDVFVVAAVTPTRTAAVEFFEFEEPTLNTTDPGEARRTEERGVRLVRRRRVSAVTLTELFEECLPPEGRIDLLSIDVEGADEAILRSNDWSRFCPVVVVFESRGRSFAEVPGLPIVRDLERVGYEVVAKCGESLIARHRWQWEKLGRRGTSPGAAGPAPAG